MKILFTPSDNNMTGAFQSMVRLCTILQEEYNCDILVLLRKHGTGEELLRAHHIRYKKIVSYNWIVPNHPTSNFRKMELVVRTITKPLAMLVNTFAQKKIVDLIAKENIDIVHLNTTYIYVSALAALKTKTPFVWHLREFLEEDQQKRIWNRKYGYNLISKADAVIAISNSLYNKYKKLIPSANLIQIYNGIDEDYYSAKKRSIFISDKVKIVIVGTINESKGQKQAIYACKQLVDRGVSNIELCLVGELTRYARKLKNEVYDLGISDYVKFVGQQKDTVAYYHKSDIALVCSRFEAFGRVTVEAMMGGCLVIGSNTGGTIELINNKKTGLLYQCGDIDDLAAKIEYAILNKKEMKEIAENGQKYMLENMTARANAERIFKVYEYINNAGEKIIGKAN